MSSRSDARRDQLTDQIAVRMQEVIAAAVLTNERIARMIGLNVVDFQTFGVLLRRGEPMTPGEIAAATELPSSTTTRVVDRLEARGMVRREADPADRRKVRVQALPFEDEQVAQAYGDILKQMREVHDGFSVAELEVVERYLAAITAVR